MASAFRPNSANTSSVCSPREGGAWRSVVGVADKRIGLATVFMLATPVEAALQLFCCTTRPLACTFIGSFFLVMVLKKN